MGRLLPLTVFDPSSVGGYQSLNRDQLAYIDFATARQQRAYRTVRELYANNVSRLNRRNAPIMDALRRSPPFTIGGWAWIYNSAATIRQGAKKGTDATVLKTNLSFNWISPFNILTAGPAPAFAISDGRPLHDFPSTCLDATPSTASPFFGASLAGTPMTFTTYLSTLRPTSPNTCSTPSPQGPRPSM